MRIDGVNIHPFSRSSWRALPAADARRLCRGWAGGVLLLLLCMAVYVPGLFSIPPVDRDESRFAQASRQMYESGDYIIPRIQDRPRLNKPPLIYWAQCASIAVFGDPPPPKQDSIGNIWVFRIPSTLAALAAVMMTWRLGLRMFDPRAALLGAALLAVSPMIVWDAHQARADQLLLATTTGAMWTLWVVWERGRGGEGERGRFVPAVLFWVAMAAGIMTKGPITPMIAALAALALCITTRRWRWLLDLRPALGLLIIAAAVGPWVFAVAQRIGWNEYLTTIYAETIGRSAGAKEGHWGPPGYHLVAFCILFWPGSLMTGLAVSRAWKRARPFRRVHPRRSAELFLLCWALPAWLVFELISTKLPHYTMPLYPALALLSARAVFAAAAGVMPAVRTLGTRIGFAMWLLIGLGLLGFINIVFAVCPPHSVGQLDVAWMVAANTATIILVLLATVALKRTRLLTAQLLGIAASVSLSAVLTARLLPAFVNVSRDTVRMLRIFGVLDFELSQVAAVGYHEDSLVFLTRGGIRRIGRHDVVTWFETNPRGLLLVGEPESTAGQWRPHPHDQEPSVVGYNYSKGRFERVRFRFVDSTREIIEYP